MNDSTLKRLVFITAALLSFASAGFHRASGDEPGGAPSPKEATTQTDADWVDDRWTRTETGQFLGAVIQTPRRITPRGIAIKIGAENDGAVCFDTDLLRYSAGWTGGFLQLHPQRYGLIAAPTPKGELQFSTAAEPGCAPDGRSRDGWPGGFGALPRDWGRYKGLYLAGKRVTLSYSIGSLEVLDSPWLEREHGEFVFTRTLNLRGTGAGWIRICDEPAGAARVLAKDRGEVQSDGGGRINAAIAASAAGAELIAEEPAALKVRFQSNGDLKIKIWLWRGAARPARGEIEDLASFTRGGAPRWLPELETRGIPGASKGPLAIDTLSMPYANPWNALMFASGHDFFENGDAALCTVHGDVWLVSGIDSTLARLRWKRFATGLHQPLGLKIVAGKPHVLERDRITILHDLNGDREADFHENFNNDCVPAGGGHGFATCLETDAENNFYFLKCAEPTPHGGSLLKVSADGQKLEVLATGFRNPNGLGVGPDGILTVADQQGEWVPETRLDVIHPGGFYGYMPMHKRAVRPTTFDPPLCWIPRAVDNSAGGQAWVPDGSWGSMQRRLLHLSYGRCAMMMILRDERNGQANGGVVPLPGRFLSGVMRGRFNPRDGALYLTGLRGWQTAAVKDGCFQRVRHAGGPLGAPISFAISRNKIELEFDRGLDAGLAEDPASYAVEQWNYRWTERYGSPDFSARDPGKEGRDRLVLSAARLKNTRRIALEFQEELRPVNIVKVAYNLEDTEGGEMRGDFYLTINQIH